MNKFLGIFFSIFIGCCVMAQDVIFQYPTSPDKVSIPQYGAVSCKFSQSKTVPNSQTRVNSNGNFKFIANKGVVFETVYPIKSVTSYTSDQNKRINDIILAITKKDYSSLNKNFDLYYIKSAGSWRLALKPKKSSKASGVMDSIIIAGGSYINQIDINTIKSGSTKINFTECKSP